MGPSLVPLPYARRTAPVRRYVNGTAMSGPEYDPLRAYADPPVPRSNPWQDDGDQPTPAMCPVGPVVLGVLPSPAMNQKYASHDAEFLKSARKGNFVLFLCKSYS